MVQVSGATTCCFNSPWLLTDFLDIFSLFASLPRQVTRDNSPVDSRTCPTDSYQKHDKSEQPTGLLQYFRP